MINPSIDPRNNNRVIRSRSCGLNPRKLGKRERKRGKGKGREGKRPVEKPDRLRTKPSQTFPVSFDRLQLNHVGRRLLCLRASQLRRILDRLVEIQSQIMTRFFSGPEAGRICTRAKEKGGKTAVVSSDVLLLIIRFPFDGERDIAAADNCLDEERQTIKRTGPARVSSL